MSNDPDIVSEEEPLIILDSTFPVYKSNNDKDTKHNRHIAKRVNFVRNGEEYTLHNIDWCEGGLQLADIATNIAE